VQVWDGDGEIVSLAFLFVFFFVVDVVETTVRIDAFLISHISVDSMPSSFAVADFGSKIPKVVLRLGP
jgi:hypothetical protein